VKRVALALLGAYVGVIGAVVHRHTVHTAGLHWPWGSALAIGVTYVVAVAAGRWIPVGAAWFGLGWAVVLMVQQLAPGGSYLIAGDWLGWTYTLGCVGGIALGVARPPRLWS
jgi:hypothetical protein